MNKKPDHKLDPLMTGLITIALLCVVICGFMIGGITKASAQATPQNLYMTSKATESFDTKSADGRLAGSFTYGQIDDYVIITKNNIDKEVDAINSYIIKGYYPQGGVSWGGGAYTQAMIHYRK
jgi:hypothetical protein